MPRFKIGKIIFEDGSTTDATVEFEASSNISIINEDILVTKGLSCISDQSNIHP